MVLQKNSWSSPSVEGHGMGGRGTVDSPLSRKVWIGVDDGVAAPPNGDRAAAEVDGPAC